MISLTTRYINAHEKIHIYLDNVIKWWFNKKINIDDERKLWQKKIKK